MPDIIHYLAKRYGNHHTVYIIGKNKDWIWRDSIFNCLLREWGKGKVYDPIAWGNLSGEAVEDLLATLISRERPHVNHIRPSSGDHGRDLEVKNEDGSIDVYQIKKFYSNLTKGERGRLRRLGIV